MGLPDGPWDGRWSLYGIALLDLLRVRSDGNNQWSGSCDCVVMESYSVREMRFWICVEPCWWYHGRRLFVGQCFCFLSTLFRIIPILTDWILKITGKINIILHYLIICGLHGRGLQNSSKRDCFSEWDNFLGRGGWHLFLIRVGTIRSSLLGIDLFLWML